MKKRVPIVIAAVLTACGAVATTSNNSAESAPQKGAKAKQPPSAGFPRYEQGGMAGCFDPRLSGYARAAAERIGGVPCAASRTTGGGAGGASGSWAGDYEGRGDGGSLSMRLDNAQTPGRYYASLEIVGEGGCSGELSAQGTALGDRMTLTQRVPDSADICRVNLTRSGQTISIRERGCTYFHGMSCGFSGSATRRGSAAASTPSSAQRQTSWIVGAWVSRGEDCQGDSGVIFERDGTYIAGGSESGRWMLSGATLTFTALETFEMGEDKATPIRNPRPVPHRILSRTANAYTSRPPRGETWNMVRCR
jgi:hypothetical protein